MQSRGCFASAFALKTFNGVKLCGHLLWSEASILHKDIYICCMENCGILYVAVILRARMWIEMIHVTPADDTLLRHPPCEDVD